MKCFATFSWFLLVIAPAFAQPPVARDARLNQTITLNGYFPFTPPDTIAEWERRKGQVREQLLVANGLWPVPEKTPLNAVIHGGIERDGYTIEKVYFASMPGHYVTGNLYRPTAKVTGKRPAVLCPHGHWSNGRFYEAPEAQAKQQVASGAEKTMEGARFPVQARMAQLARMGFIVFHYDMVGYADSTAITHRVGFTDVEAELRLQSFMGLQTWNTIRAFDFLADLPDVDAKRMGVTGSSGGGTQTFILCALDDRPAVSFPAVMVSTAMQGGCVCENASYLRVGTGNVEFAGMFAPRPLAMSAADDWTIEIEKKGYPQLQQLFAMYDRPQNVYAKCWPEFKHNYNQPARELMYTWFNQHLLNTKEAVAEQRFVPVPPKELSVFDAGHAVPRDALPAEQLRKLMTESATKQMAAIAPVNAEKAAEYRRVIGSALGVMVGDFADAPVRLDTSLIESTKSKGVTTERWLIGRVGSGEKVPAMRLIPTEPNGESVVWIHPKGNDSLREGAEWHPAVTALLNQGVAVVSIDAFQTGQLVGAPMVVDANYAGFTFGYNRSLLAQRVHDVRSALTFAQSWSGKSPVHAIGWESAGLWVGLARALTPKMDGRTIMDAQGFRFEAIAKTSDERMLSGALKYGGLPGLLALIAPHELWVFDAKGTGLETVTVRMYATLNAAKSLTLTDSGVTAKQMVEYLLRR